MGRKQGVVKVTIQSKDGPPQAPFRLVIESEGPTHDPTLIRLKAEDLETGTAEEELKEQAVQALATLPKTEALMGCPGVTLRTITEALKRKSEKPIRQALQSLHADGRVHVVGKGPYQADLWKGGALGEGLVCLVCTRRNQANQPTL
jgi:hypothetical protein